MRNNEERLGAPMQRQDPDTLLQQQLQQTPNLGAMPLSFVTPTEFVALPSKGKFYPQHHPLHGKDSIEIKQMTAKEEDILTSRSLLKKGVALDRLIQSLVLDQTINTDSLTIEDRSAIVIAARISAYGPDYATTVTCPSCGEKNKTKFNLLEKLEKQEEEKQLLPVDENGYFTVALPNTKWNLVCRALNGYDEKEMSRNDSTKKKNELGGDSLLMQQLKFMTVSVQGVDDKPTIEKALSVLPAADSKYLRKVYADNVESVDLNHSFNCKSCDVSTELEVPLTADFFWFK